MKKSHYLVWIFALLWFLLPFSGFSQASGNIGLGAQIGRPTGITLKVYTPGPVALDFLAAWDLDEFFFLNVHGLWQQPVGEVEQLFVFYGPGVFLGVRDRDHRRDEDNELALGISGTVGLSYFLDRFEIFLQLTPRVQLIEKTDGDYGGGAGFRFYF